MSCTPTITFKYVATLEIRQQTCFLPVIRKHSSLVTCLRALSQFANAAKKVKSEVEALPEYEVATNPSPCVCTSVTNAKTNGALNLLTF